MNYIITAILIPLVWSKPFDEINSLHYSTTSDVTLVTFDGEPGTTFTFIQTNDPVMVGYFKNLTCICAITYKMILIYYEKFFDTLISYKK